jgi:hypothetical protein
MHREIAIFGVAHSASGNSPRCSAANRACQETKIAGNPCRVVLQARPIHKGRNYLRSLLNYNDKIAGLRMAGGGPSINCLFHFAGSLAIQGANS